MSKSFLIKVLIAIFFFVLLLVIPNFSGLNDKAMRVLALAVLMIILWFSEAIPIVVTALLPLVLLPILNVQSIEDVAVSYGDSTIMLFLGGFVIAEAMQETNLHRRIAFNILIRTGTSPVFLIFGLLAVSGFLSMWMSNSATTAMLFPIVMSILGVLSSTSGGMEDKKIHIPLLLSIAYGASLGGIATPIGTPPNALLIAYIQKTFGYTIGFFDWMKIGFPISVGLLFAVWIYFIFFFRLKNKPIEGAQEIIDKEYKNLGRMTYAQWVVLIVFVLVVFGWICGSPINKYFGTHLTDVSIAILGAIVLFAYPMKSDKGQFLLPIKSLSKLSWGTLLIFGGGLALGSSFEASGVSTWIASNLGFLEGYSLIAIVSIITIVLIYMTELTSNTATAATFIPLVSALALHLGQNALFLVVPMTIAISCAFMLPAGTPPNAIVFGSEKLKITDMAIPGFFLNIISAIIILILSYFLLKVVFDVQPNVIPAWQMKH